MLRNVFSIDSFKFGLSKLFNWPFVTFFLDEKSNQKNQVLCINSVLFA